MRIGELTYTAADAKKVIFAQTSLTRSDISFVKGNPYAILHFKQSKTNRKYIRM